MRAKIDTGARTSALDVARYELHPVEGQGLVAELHLVLGSRHAARTRIVRVPVICTVVVCNSGGMREQRPLIEAEVRLGPVAKRIRLTVTNRAGMRFRIGGE